MVAVVEPTREVALPGMVEMSGDYPVLEHRLRVQGSVFLPMEVEEYEAFFDALEIGTHIRLTVDLEIKRDDVAAKLKKGDIVGANRSKVGVIIGADLTNISRALLSQPR